MRALDVVTSTLSVAPLISSMKGTTDFGPTKWPISSKETLLPPPALSAPAPELRYQLRNATYSITRLSGASADSLVDARRSTGLLPRDRCDSLRLTDLLLGRTELCPRLGLRLVLETEAACFARDGDLKSERRSRGADVERTPDSLPSSQFARVEGLPSNVMLLALVCLWAECCSEGLAADVDRSTGRGVAARSVSGDEPRGTPLEDRAGSDPPL